MKKRNFGLKPIIFITFGFIIILVSIYVYLAISLPKFKTEGPVLKENKHNVNSSEYSAKVKEDKIVKEWIKRFSNITPIVDNYLKNQEKYNMAAKDPSVLLEKTIDLGNAVKEGVDKYFEFQSENKSIKLKLSKVYECNVNNIVLWIACYSEYGFDKCEGGGSLKFYLKDKNNIKYLGEPKYNYGMMRFSLVTLGKNVPVLFYLIMGDNSCIFCLYDIESNGKIVEEIKLGGWHGWPTFVDLDNDGILEIIDKKRTNFEPEIDKLTSDFEREEIEYDKSSGYFNYYGIYKFYKWDRKEFKNIGQYITENYPY